jgi:hypothetical protein
MEQLVEFPGQRLLLLQLLCQQRLMDELVKLRIHAMER